MTLSEIAKCLTDAGISDGRFEAGLLIEHFTGVTRAKMLAEPMRDYDAPELCRAVEKRCERYPLQYLLGVWEFMGLPFLVNEHCLIPRPDTECVVEAAIAACEELCPGGGRVLDLCTGSGCIIGSILHYAKNTVGVAVELYPETAALAEQNIAALGLDSRCRVMVGDAACDLFEAEETFHVIVSNPPYITAEEMADLEPELSYEPRAALTDEKNGLTLLEPIIRIYRKHLTPGGVMLLEHGWHQSEAVLEIARRCGMEGQIIRDFGGNIRGCRLH